VAIEASLGARKRVADIVMVAKPQLKSEKGLNAVLMLGAVVVMDSR